jgi:DNA modification methylase
MVMGRQDYQWQHEPILYGWKAGAAHKWYGNFDKKTVIDDQVDVSKLKKEELLEIVKALQKNTSAIREDQPNKNGEHPKMKPINLVARFVWNSSRPEDIVLDTFLGSGSTLIACEQTDRICYGMELDPKYVDVIRKRYAKYCYPDTWEQRWVELTPEITR